MRILATLVMRGRSQAVMMASLLAMLSLLVTPVGVLSSAVVALVTLRLGEREGLVTIGLATGACALLSLLVFRSAFLALGFALLLWLPIWVVAVVLRNGRSLALAVETSLVFALVMIGVFYLQFPNPAETWQEWLEPVSRALVEAEVMSEQASAESVGHLARWMTGLVAAGFFLQNVLALLLARWWQAFLYNPGGFRQEFHGLRLHRATALFALPFAVVALIGAGEGWDAMRYVFVVLLSAFFLQGLAVAHSMVATFEANPAWLFGLYVLLVLAMPQMVGVLAVSGYLDAFLDFRSRYGTKANG